MNDRRPLKPVSNEVIEYLVEDINSADDPEEAELAALILGGEPSPWR